MIAEKLEKALIISRERGINKFFRPILQRVPSFIFEANNHVWFERHLNSEQIEINPEIPLTMNLSNSEFNETFNWIKEKNFLWGLYEKEKEIAIREGHYWINVKFNGSIIGFEKIGFGKVFISDYRKTIEFPKNIIFIYEYHVLPEFRSKKVAQYMTNENFKFFQKKGFTKALTYIHNWNTPSIKSMTHSGMKRIKTVYCYRTLGLTFLTSNPADL